MLQGEGRFGWLSAVLTSESAGRAVIAAALVLAGFGPGGALVGVSLAMGLAYLLGLVPLRGLLRPGPVERVAMRDVMRFALPAVAAVGGITFLYNADIVLVGHFMSDRAGVYASAATLGRIVYFATFSITGVMFPNVAAQVARGESAVRTLRFSALAMASIAALLVAGFIVLPNLALLPFGGGFKAAGPYLPVFGLAMGLLSIANLLVNYLLASGNRTFALVLVAAGALEVVLISGFHSSIWQVVLAVLAVLVVTVLGLAAVLLRDNRVVRPAPSPASAPGGRRRV
jgi:O-antigen/teichoic acid export membrane protein